MEDVLARVPGMMEISAAQELIGRMAFCARFITRGRARMNSAYACMASAEHLQVAKRQMMVSREMVDDMREFWHEVAQER